MPHHNTYRSEDELLAGLRRGEPGAHEAFFDRYADPIHGFGLKVCGDAAAAREVLQDTLVTATRSVKDVKHAKALTRWLFKVAVHAALPRCAGGRPAAEIRLDDLTPDPRGGGPEEHDWSLDPDEEVRREEEKRLLKEAVADLPPAHRLVLVLHDMEEFAANDVSEILQIPVSAVRTRLHAARLFVRKELTRRLQSGGSRVKVS